jgi:RHS repeat-associated protein
MTGVAPAQVATGTPQWDSYGGGPFDIVNLGNLNVHFSIPILHKAGRGMPFTYDLGYDSSVWTPGASNGVYQWVPALNWGWSPQTAPTTGYVSTGSVTFTTHTPSCAYSQSSTEEDYSNFIFVDSYGVSHAVPGTIALCITPGSEGYSWIALSNLSNIAAGDGSGYTLTTSWCGASCVNATVAGTHGFTSYPPFNPPSFVAGIKTDHNGNQINVSSGQFFDTLSSTSPALTVAGSGTSTSPITFTYTAPSGGSAIYKMHYSSYTVATGFGVPGIAEYGPVTNVPLVDYIALPDDTQSSQDRYSFTYESGPSSCSPCVTGRIASVTLPTGGTITYAYTGGSNGIYIDGSTAGLNRTLSPGGEWTYSRSLVSGSPVPGSSPGAEWTTTIVDPNSNNTVINFSEATPPCTNSPFCWWGMTMDLFETQRKVYQGSVSTNSCSSTITNNCLLLTTFKCYNANYANCSTTPIYEAITQTDAYTQLLNGSTRLTETLYNLGYATDVKEYTYGVALGGAPSSTYLIRETATSIPNLSPGALALPASKTVYDWSSGTKTTLASTTYSYDGTAATNTTGTPQHIPNHSFGNLTTIATQASTGTTLYRVNTYYDTGNIKTATDAGTTSSGGPNLTTYNYSSTGSCGNSFATLISEPLSLTRSYTWNCTGGVTLTATDENSSTTTTDYSTNANFWWPDYTQDPLLNKTTLNYAGQTAVESNLSFNGANSVSDLRTTLDGFGRPILSQRAQTPSLTEYDSFETDYNNIGQVSRSTMPFQAAAGVTNSTAPATTAAYDALGRPTLVTDGGGGTVSYTYTNNDVLQTVGPTQNFKKQFEYDGLGRLTSVCEISTTLPGVGTCGQATTQTGYWTRYTYDALGNLLTVTQNAQAASGSRQSRTYVYDMLSRLTSETNPETGRNGVSGTVNYTYDIACGSYLASTGDLTKRVDNAGNTTCYQYDALHRLTDGGNSGPTCRHYRYGAQTPPTGVSISPMAAARLTEAYTDACSGSKLTDEWFGYDADGNLTQFYESTPHSGGYYQTKATYWANGAIDALSALNSSSTAIFPAIYYGSSTGGSTGAGIDGEGRITKVYAASGTNPATSATYVTSGTSEPIGALTSVTLGSTDSDSFTFDPTTGRPHTYTFSVNGATDVGTLNWNTNGTLGTLAITDGLPNATDTQTCTYVYDDLARVAGIPTGQNAIPGVNCVQGSTTVWSQTFTYDAFGNITKSGTGTFSPIYRTSPPTNQFSSIPGVTVSYDNNGNLLTDNLNTYTWDSKWGNPASINGTILIYDAQGQMVEQQNGTAYIQLLYSQAGKTAIMNGQALTKGFVKLPGGATAIYNSSAPAYYRHADWLGSSRVTSTAARGVYSTSAYAPFGEQYNVNGTADASFTGQNADTTSSLYDFTFREYSPSQGRWISPDPAGTSAADPTNPRSWNRYAYVLNNPLIYTDPLGLFCVWDDGSYDSNDDPQSGSSDMCAGLGGTWFNGTPQGWLDDPNAPDSNDQASGEFASWAYTINPNGVDDSWMAGSISSSVDGGPAPQVDTITSDISGGVTSPADPCTSRGGRAYGPGHYARDYGLPSYGTPIPAPENGTVTGGRSNALHIPGPYDYSQTAPPGSANFTQFSTESGYILSYVHVHPVVPIGTTVSQGNTIGVSDNSGRITGPHTHVQITNPFGVRIDPNSYFTGCQ